MTDAPANFGKLLFSPPVLIGGAVLGLVLMLASRGGSAPAAPAGPSTAELGAVTTMNQAAIGAQTTLAGISANAGAAMYAQDTIRQGQLLGFLNNQSNNQTVLAGQIVQSQAGITNNSIVQAFNLAADAQANMVRLTQTYVGGQVALANDRANVAMSANSAQASMYAAKQQAIASIVTGLGNDVTRVATGSFL